MALPYFFSTIRLCMHLIILIMHHMTIKVKITRAEIIKISFINIFFINNNTIIHICLNGILLCYLIQVFLTKKAPLLEVLFIGSDYLIRTDDRSVNSRLLYRWAKSEYWRPVPESNRYRRISSPLHEPFCQPAILEYQRRGDLYLYMKNFERQHLFFKNVKKNLFCA